MSARILVVDDSPTIRKVVKSILEARAYETVLAEDGQDALEMLGHEKIDLVLLDFVMPRMNGYQFCRELRAHPELKNLPVVLMSAKGDKIRGQFVQQTGATDAITKPFDARGLVAVVEAVLKKQEQGRNRRVPDAAAMPADEDSMIESLRPSRSSLSEDPGLRRKQAAEELAGALTRLLTPELSRMHEFPGEAVDLVGTAIERTITPDTMGALGTLMKTLSFGENTREVLAGDVSVVSIAEILQLMDLQRQTGALSVFTRESEITLYIRQGKVDFASWHGLRDEFLLGRYLVEDGALTREELQTVLDNRAGSKRLLGETLVQLGFTSEEAVKRGLYRQSSELVYEVVRWKTGRFSFVVAAENPAAEKAILGMETGPLVMEGFRRVDEWRLIEGSFDFEEVLYPDPVAIQRLGEEANLTRQERAVLEAIDGERTIREIVNEVEGSSFELCKILYQFLNSRLVRRKAA
ncbi:MAG TPA: response regulator [Polyangiaceae bacterium]|jgi:DNA-binding response OmpR family regulator|nr:response regulator [Polyangiaceae bacterium]